MIGAVRCPRCALVAARWVWECLPGAYTPAALVARGLRLVVCPACGALGTLLAGGTIALAAPANDDCGCDLCDAYAGDPLAGEFDRSVAMRGAA